MSTETVFPATIRGCLSRLEGIAQGRFGDLTEGDREAIRVAHELLVARYDAHTGNERTVYPDLHARLTEIVDSAFGPMSTMPVEELLILLEKRAEEMRVERLPPQDNARDMWLLTPLGSMGRTTIQVEQYEELRKLAVKLAHRAGEEA